MKANITRSATKVTLFAAALLTTCLLARPANAQAGIQGRFTLPYETHWGQAVLPAGDYLLTLTHDSMSPMLAIRNAKNLRIVAFEPANIREDSTNGESALLIGKRGEQRVVYSLKIADLGEAFVYDRALTRAVEEARQTQAVPIVVAEK
jgi:hypothetical protein